MPVHADNDVRWVACDGGPHLLLPSELATSWSGICPPRDGRVINAKFRWSGDRTEPASDYDAACDVDDLVGLVALGEGFALVLGDVVPMSTWVASTQFTGGLLVVPMQWPEPNVADWRLLEAVHAVGRSSFMRTGISVKSASGSFVLCAAADYGPSWCYPTLMVAIAPGEYRVHSVETEVQGFSLRLHGLQPVS